MDVHRALFVYYHIPGKMVGNLGLLLLARKARGVEHNTPQLLLRVEVMQDLRLLAEKCGDVEAVPRLEYRGLERISSLEFSAL